MKRVWQTLTLVYDLDDQELDSEHLEQKWMGNVTERAKMLLQDVNLSPVPGMKLPFNLVEVQIGNCEAVEKEV